MNRSLVGIAVLCVASTLVGCSSSSSGSDAYCKVVADTAPAVAKLNQLGSGKSADSVDQVVKGAKEAVAARRQASPPELKASWDAVDIQVNTAKGTELSAKEQQAGRDGSVAIDRYTTDVCKSKADMMTSGSDQTTTTKFTPITDGIS